MDEITYEVCGYNIDFNKYTTYFKTKDKDKASEIAHIFANNLRYLCEWRNPGCDMRYAEPIDWIEIWKGWPNPEERVEIIYE